MLHFFLFQLVHGCGRYCVGGRGGKLTPSQRDRFVAEGGDVRLLFLVQTFKENLNAYLCVHTSEKNKKKDARRNLLKKGKDCMSRRNIGV